MNKNNAHRIILVDDHPENLLLLEEILGAGSYRVSSFLSGEEALAAARKQPPDLFLLDVMMPEMDGFTLCGHLKKDPVFREIPVIFISALHDMDFKSKSFRLGGVDYITKPFHEQEILARVSTHLGLFTQKKKLSEALEKLHKLEQARQQFTQMLVHDFRSPLTGISMGLEIIKMESNPEVQHSVVEQSLCTVERLKLMVNSLLDYGRLESASLPLHREFISVRSILEAPSPGVQLEACQVKISGKDKVFCDPKLTQRVLLNLLSNALKHSVPEDVIVEAQSEGAFVKISVRDKGPGISKMYQKNIFEMYQQGPDSQAVTRKGSGIGLAFCKLAVEAQGGKIGVTSTPGEGACFWFTLPAGAVSEEVTGV